jgi:hypothetical protein
MSFIRYIVYKRALSRCLQSKIKHYKYLNLCHVVNSISKISFNDIT